MQGSVRMAPEPAVVPNTRRTTFNQVKRVFGFVGSAAQPFAREP